jgi:hypothetical protein
MSDKSSISDAQSYMEMGAFWDTHDVTEYWDETEPVEFEIDIQSEVTHWALEKVLSQQIVTIAQHKGVTAEALVNLWIRDKVAEALTEIEAH